MTGIRVLVERFSPPRGAVVIPSPVYPPFAIFTREIGRKVVTVALTADGRLDVAAIDEALAANRTDAASRRTVLLLCSPHNPTGVVHTAAELAAVAGVRAPPRGPRHRGRGARATGPDGSDVRTVVRGRRPRLRRHLRREGVQPCRTQGRADRRRTGGPRPVEAPARFRGLRRQPSWCDRACRGLPLGPVVAGCREREHRRRTAPCWPSSSPNVFPGRGTAFPRRPTWRGSTCAGVGLGQDPAEVLLERGRVALHAGRPFGRGGIGHARLNLACSQEVLTEAVDRMAVAVAAHAESKDGAGG